MRALVLAAFLLTAISVRAQILRLAPEHVTATRLPQPVDQVSANVRVLDADTLRQAPTATLDAALRSVPGFSLFRRSDSFSANPTAQGVSLRGLGPSGASRSLVLLDDVPLNDPFGGWIAWTKVPREGLGRVEILPGGGATAWGNAALGGVLQLLSDVSTRNASSAVATLGDFATRSAELSWQHPLERDVLTLRGRIFSTDGFPLVAPERRGSIDVPAWSRHRWASAGWRHEFSPNLQLAATARAYEEKRGNGTPYQRNSSREKFASLHAAGAAGPLAWQAVAYAQDQSFASTFSAVNATRTAETPASDQFDVPATAFGASWTGTWRHAPASGPQTTLGLDARRVTGETRENFTFLNGAFTRQRVAGGRQDVGGVFVAHERALATALRINLGARIDTWRETDGHRRETDRVTGALLRDDRYSERDGTAFSPSLGLVFTPARPVRFHANAQRAFRRPTLNELYRPFRVGPNITEANAGLATERVTSAELGVTWSPSFNSPPSALAPLTLSATAFHNQLDDAVANVTVARGPGTYPLFGVIPAGGVGRQRLNLDRTRVRGLELSARWAPTRHANLSADYLYNDATVTRATVAPALVGQRIAQVPRHSAALGASLRPFSRLTLTPRVRWIDRQFEDDENQLVLGAAVITDLGLNYQLRERPNLSVFLTCENLFDTRIETGRTADGLVNIGTPRLLLGGFRGSW